MISSGSFSTIKCQIIWFLLFYEMIFFSQAKIFHMLTLYACAKDKPPIDCKMNLMQTEIHREEGRERRREKWEKSITCFELCLQRYDDDLCKQAQDL